MDSLWFNLAKEAGPYVGIMFFFVWRDYRREERLEKRVDTLNIFIRDQLMKTLEKTQEALNRVR